MPKPLFYLGTAFCLFLALTTTATVAQELERRTLTFVAVRGADVVGAWRAGAVVAVALIAGVAVAAILLRMAALLAARNLFGGFLALFAIGAALVSFTWVLLLQARMIMLVRREAALIEMHFVAVMMFGLFAAFAFLSLRPYFRVQASRILSALVIFPMPLFALMFFQEFFVVPQAPRALPAASPASAVLFGVVAILFFAIAVHCIRHRHMFIELTSLRELLDPPIDPAHPGRTIGGVAFDS